MSQANIGLESQNQSNHAEGNHVEGNFIFAPTQTNTYTYIKTQTIKISVDKVTQKLLNIKSPYKGLTRFNVKDRECFFGRDKLIEKLFEAVNNNSFSLVLGASGSGKSSLIRAGLIPELEKYLEKPQKFYDFVFTPNQDPFESLYRCLLHEEKDYNFDESDVDFVREGKPNTLPQLISKLKKNEERWFFFIDQFEQLFTTCTDLEKRKNFIEGIVQVAKKKDSSVRIVLAMRSDFLEQFSFYPTLGAITNQNNIHLVTEMYPDEVREAIEQPAAKHGVVFEKGLVEQIIKELEGQSGYLPLLQYTLNLLWKKKYNSETSDSRVENKDRILSKKSYTSLGGVRGALQERVNEIYKDICKVNKDGELIIKQVFLKLVNIVESESGSKAVSRRAYRYEFVGESVNNTVDRFVNENLLVSDDESLNQEQLLLNNSKKHKENATIEIAHEILLSSWDKLKRWLEEEKEAIILKNWLAGETKRWLEVQANDELLKGSRLAQTVEFRENNTFEKLGGLNSEENKFIDESVKWRDIQEKQAKRRRLTTLLGLSIFSAVALGLSSFAWYQAQEIAKASAEAIKQTEIAKRQRAEAIQQKELAEKRRIEAEKQQEIAEKRRIEAEKQKRIAQKQQEKAEIESAIAKVQSKFLVETTDEYEHLISENNIDKMTSAYDRYYTWLLDQEYKDPNMNKLTKLMKKSCPNALNAMDCKEWVNRLFPQESSTN